MEDQSWATRGCSFGAGADFYDRTRPDYPVDSVRWALGDEAATVVDLGAGTGILTRRLVELGYQTVAIEPDDAMRDQLAESSPTATVMAGTAESIPLPDSSVDVVLAGQAYHWFDPAPSHAEIARVTRPGGVFAALWNLRDESVPWSAELSAILHEEDTGVDTETVAEVMLHGIVEKIFSGTTNPSGWLANPTFGKEFGPVTWQAFRHAMPHSPETLLDLIRSRSYYRTASAPRQLAMEHAVRKLMTTHPALAGRNAFDLPYVTLVYRAHRLPHTDGG